MKEDTKPNLKLVSKDSVLTIKQKQFVDEIIKGKLGSQIDCYMKVYDVSLTKAGKTPKHAHVDCSKLMTNPKINLAIRKGMERRDTNAVASSLRTRNYVIDRLYAESKESDSDASRIRSLELLGKTIGLFSDVIETKEARSSEEVEADIEEKIAQLLTADQDH
tara:strand:- start:572 stop:1060 length:489 start_codon:yes stop_codon:yes gene_type:complete